MDQGLYVCVCVKLSKQFVSYMHVDTPSFPFTNLFTQSFRGVHFGVFHSSYWQLELSLYLLLSLF